MTLRTKLAVVGVVLAAGTVAAFCFRKPVTDVQAPAPSATTLPLRDKDTTVAGTDIAPAAAPQGVPLPGTPGPGSATTVDSPMGGDFAQAAKPKLAPPRLPPAFSSEAPSSTSAPIALADGAKSPARLPDLRGNYREAPALEPAPRPSAVAVSAAPRPIERPAPWRSHVVADGDTLSTLAARYLGSAGRFAEILEANRTVLRSADMLPIGMVLRIPPQTPPSVLPVTSPVSMTAAEENRFPHLVPIPSGVVTNRAAAE